MPVGVKATPLLTPLSQIYVDAPPPLRVISSPEQTVVLLAFAVTVGNGFTVTMTLAVLVQPVPASVPVTLYVFVPVGVKATPSLTPLSQVYVDAPPPLRVISSPVHTDVLVEFAVTIGNGFTAKV